MNHHTTMLAAGALVALALGGCASTEPSDMQALRSSLESERAQREELASALERARSELETTSSELVKREQMLASAEGKGGTLLPPGAKAGECYARVFIPPQYENVTKTVLAKEASTRMVSTKPVYDWVEERVLVKEASKRLEVLPARYEWVEEKVLVSDASEELKVVPAVYRDQEERVLVREAYTTWKKGRGPIERIDEATGEIMCLVEVPAEYKTVVKKVLVTPATTRSVAIPPEYKTVKRKVMVEPPRTVEVEEPAEYRTVRVRKLVTPAKTQTVEVPEAYQTVTQTRLLREGHLEWRPILCETNTTPDVIRKLQSALLDAGYPPGRLDGVLGPQTMAAVSRYQRSQGLASGKLTLETLRRLEVI